MANKKVSQLSSKASVLLTDLFPIADPSTGQLYKTTISDLGTAIGSGVSSVNGLVGAVVLDTDDIQELVSPTNKWFTDTRARAALSASSPLTYNSGTGAFGIQVANGSQNGYLSSTDWTTFNSKQAALSGTGFVKISGTTISYDNTSYLPLTGGTLTGTLNGTNISISNSLTAKGGTFNGGASGGVVTIDGLGSDLLMNRSNTSNGSSITLLTNAVEKWNIGLRSAGTTDNFFIYNSNLLANSLTISSATSAATFTSSVTASSLIKSGGTSSQFLKADGSVDSSTYLTTSSASSTYLPLSGGTLTGALSGTTLALSGGTGGINFTSSTTITNTAASGYTAIYANGGGIYLGGSASVNHLSIASTGAATFSSSLTAGGTIAGDWFTLNLNSIKKFNINLDSDWTTVTSTANRLQLNDYTNTGISINGGKVGIGTTSPSYKLEVDASNPTNGIISQFYNTATSSQNGSFVLITQYGVADWFVGQPSGTNALTFGNGKNLNTVGSEYMRITSGGNVGIGLTNPQSQLHINGTITLTEAGYDTVRKHQIDHSHSDGNSANNAIKFLVSDGSGTTAERMRITGAGNVGIGNNASNVRLFVGGSGTSSAAFVFTAGDSGGNTLFSVRNDGFINTGLQSISPYNNATTGRSMVIQNDGGLGYLVSTREAKTNINKLEDVSWLYKLNPVSYNYRKRDNNMNYTEDFDLQNWYGLIADEVEKVNEDLVFYNYNDKGKKLAGVEYNNIISALVKGIQDLKVKIDILENK